MTDMPPAVAELTGAEHAVVKLAAEILEDPNVSTQDNFLDLGGHSVLALELRERVKERFAVELDMQLLFERSIGETAADVVSRSKSTDQNGSSE